MNSSFALTQTGHAQLQRLITLRLIAIFVQCATLLLVHYFLALTLPWLQMMIAIALLATFNLFSWWRLHSTYPVSNGELFAQLCADVAALSALLYFSGGSTNPFISLYLLPLVIAAASLPPRFVWPMALLTTTCYTLLMQYYVPLPNALSHANHGMDEMMDHAAMAQEMPATDAFNIHIFGMWLGFVISATVVAYFVVKMANAVRQRDETLARVREKTLRNEQIVALGLQAASAAHEMGTPLATLSVVIGELQHETDALPEWRDSLLLLDGQVRNCKRILDKLLAKAQDSARGAAQSWTQFMRDTLDEWQLLRPTAKYNFIHINQGVTPKLPQNTALRAALLNVLNNAADASPADINLYLDWDETQLIFKIEDAGTGLTAEVAANLGAAFFTTKQSGRGLGLFLANATIEQLGGNVRLYNRKGGGTTTEVLLPREKQA